MNLKPSLMFILLTVVSALGWAQAPKSIQPTPYEKGNRQDLKVPEWKDTKLEKSIQKYYELTAKKQRILPSKKNKNWALDNKGGGGMDGGGGTIVKGGAWSADQLLDLVNFPVSHPHSLKKFRFESNTHGQCSLSPFLEPPAEFTETLMELFQPLIRLGVENNNRFSEPINLVSLAVNNFKLVLDKNNFSEKLLDVNAFVREPQKRLSLYPAAFYIQGKGLAISEPALARLPAVHQYGLLIHEVLRQISIGYELYISDMDLQKMTSLLLENSRPNFNMERDSDFKQSGLPAQMYLGPLTKYIIRNHINDLCATRVAVSDEPNDAGNESALCENFAGMDVDHMYKVLPEMKNELLRLYGFTEKTPEERNQAWLTWLDIAHRNLLVKAKSYIRDMRLSPLIRSVLYQGPDCNELSRYLHEGQ